MTRKGFAPIFIIVVVAIAAVFGGWYYVKKNQEAGSKNNAVPTPQATPPVAATATSTEDATASWKTYRNEKYGFELSYPKTFNYKETINGTPAGSIKDYLEVVFDTSDSSSTFFLVVNGSSRGVGCPNKATQDNDCLAMATRYKSGKNAVEIYGNVRLDEKIFHQIVLTFKSFENDISIWNRYRNDKYGFEVRYPASWETYYSSPYADSPFPRVVFSYAMILSKSNEEVTTETMENNARFEIDVRTERNLEKLSMGEWFDKYLARNVEIKGKISTTIDNRPALRVESVELAPRFHYFIEQGVDVIDIAYPYEQEKYKDLYGRILSTFRFTK